MDHSENLLQQECFMTRPISRIHRILEKLETVWLEKPDLRLCQLLSSLATGHPTWPDIFYFEDTKLEKEIDEAIARQAKQNTGA